MIDKITLEEFVEEVYQDQLDLLKESDLSPKERNEKKEKLKEFILESESLEELFDALKKLGYSQSEINEYVLSIFIDS